MDRTWRTSPGSNRSGGDQYRTQVIPDQWELYDLDNDPIEAINRWRDPSAAEVFGHLQSTLEQETHAFCA